MPTNDRTQALSMDEALARAGEVAFAGIGSTPKLGGIGLEPELFPVKVDAAGRPAGRLQLSGPNGVVEIIDALAEKEDRIGLRQGPKHGPWEYVLANGGRLTFEPGAQVEHSSAVHQTVSSALHDVQETSDLLQQAFADRGVALAAIGLDPWHDVADVPQQLRSGRYICQAEFYHQRGPWGRVMMRHTASLQVNLDLGPEGVWQQRWRLANLMSPLITASFACSPKAEGVCARALAWQRLDPTRTGFPLAFVADGGVDPRLAYAQAVLDADVMLFKTADDAFVRGTPGFHFGRWILDGHHCLGWPTLEDFDYHLTTVFFEVRTRGFLELRAGEALPDQWRAVQVVLITALLYDDQAREQALDLLTPLHQHLPDLWHRASVAGVRDPEIGPLAEKVWQLALDSVSRFPDGYFGCDALVTANRFLERYTLQRRMPADELRELSFADPSRALAWATSGWSEKAR